MLNNENGKINVSQGTTQSEQNSEQILYQGPDNGHLRLVSVILTGDWLGAQAALAELDGKEFLKIQQSDKSFELNLEKLEK